MTAGPGDAVAEGESDEGAEDTNEHALGDEDAANLTALDTHGHEDSDVAGFFHDHHGERDEDVEGGDEDDQSDGNEGDEALEAEGVEQRLVLLHPVGGHEAAAGSGLIGGFFERIRDLGCEVDVVELELDDGDDVAEAEEGLGLVEADEGPGRIVIVETGVEDADDAEANVLGNHAEGSEFALGRSDEHDGVDGGADFLGEIAAENDGRHGGDAIVDGGEVVGGGLCGGLGGLLVGLGRDGVSFVGLILVGPIFVEFGGRSDGDGLEEIADFAFVTRNHALEHGAASAGAAGDEDLLVNGGSGGNDVRFALEFCKQRTPVADAIAFDAEEADVGGRTKQAGLQVLAKTVVDGERDDERSDSGGDASDGDGGDEADDGLPSFCAKVTSGDEELEAHER